MRKLLKIVVVLALIGLAVFWFVTRPSRVDPDALAGLSGDAAKGEQVFWAAGCAACHAAPKAEGEARLVLAGGMAFASPFGTFFAPNISPDPEHGIGGWSLEALVNAMKHGTGPNGAHYYPAFPYTSYARAELADIADLHAFLATLPASDAANTPHDVGFPFNIRRSLGGWKFLFSRPEWVMDVSGDELERGRYLVEALGHCGECHTPRNALGGLDYSRWLQGAATPDGKGKVPALTPDALTWSAVDIAAYLGTGFTPDFDSAGGHMADVVLNLANLPKSDLAAIAAYLKAMPAADG
ncbi:cytochrome c [Rhodobacteraceae bacterium D3-12]|nr:cytochrome c [Rhodobacteraceae bacterium D3-12]